MAYIKLPHFSLDQSIEEEVIANWDSVYGDKGWLFDSGGNFYVRENKVFSEDFLYFVTGNKGKVRSAQMSLEDIPLKQLELEINEDGNSVERIAAHKARVGYATIRRPVIADDSGFVIPSLGGWPGARVGRELEENGFDYFKNLARDAGGKLDCYWEMSLAYSFGLWGPKLFSSRSSGHLISEERVREGKQNSFVKSPLAKIFVVEGQDKTVAEMTREEYVEHAKTDRWDRFKEVYLGGENGN